MTHLYKLPRDHLSASALTMLLRCPKQFEFRYIDGHIVPPGAALIKGSAAHRVFETYFKGALDGRTRFTPEQTAELSVSVLDDLLQEQETRVSVSELENMRATLPHLTRTYITQVASRITPLAVEEEIRYRSRCGVTMLGYLDLRYRRQPHGETELGDYKISSKRWTLPLLVNSVQFNLYAVMTGITRVSVHNLIPSAVKSPVCKKPLPAGVIDIAPSIRIVRHRFDGAMTEHLEQLIERAARLISSGIFMPCDPGAWWCMPEWCGYWTRCRGKSRSEVFDMAG